MSKFTRREFLKTGGLALAGLTIAPSTILGRSHGHVPPSDRLNIAAVGIGGMGHTNINHVKNTENIVALCDVDWRYAKGVFDEFPNAKKYWDDRCYCRPYTCHHYSRCHDNGQTRILPKTADALCI